MTMSHDRGPAAIYQFPPRGRFAVGGRRDESDRAPGVASSPPPAMAFGGSWYHEEAIRESERARKR
jgi:hypothetical protein